jgi:hypothetical protein
MSILLYNNDLDTFRDLYRTPYENVDEYVDPADDLSPYDVLYFVNLTDVFTIAKRRSSLRARFARDAEGRPLVENLAMTDDERDWFDDIMPIGSAAIFKKLSAFAKGIQHAHKYGVTFGGKVAVGTIESIAGNIISDSSLSLTPSALKGYKLVLTSGTEDLINQEQLILDNTANTITVQVPWEQDVTGLSFNIYNPSEDYVLYTVRLDTNWDLNMIHNVESSVMEAMISYALKEWYLINRYMDDYAIEDAKFKSYLSQIKSSLDQGVNTTERPMDMFGV